MTSKLIRMVMVDDHLALLDSFHKDFSEENGFTVVAKLASADDADEVCRRLCPDLVLMDVCTEDGASGLDALARLRPEFPDMKILMMSGFDEMSYAPRARELGAQGFLFKSRSFDLFMEAARGVFVGTPISPSRGICPPRAARRRLRTGSLKFCGCCAGKKAGLKSQRCYPLPRAQSKGTLTICAPREALIPPWTWSFM